MNKKKFFKILRRHIPADELRERVWETDEFWRSSAIEIVKNYRYALPAGIYKELLRYLFKARCRFDSIFLWSFFFV